MMNKCKNPVCEEVCMQDFKPVQLALSILPFALGNLIYFLPFVLGIYLVLLPFEQGNNVYYG